LAGKSFFANLDLMTLTGSTRGSGLILILGAVAFLAGCYSDPNPNHRFVFPGSQAALSPEITGTAPSPAARAGDSFSYLRRGDLITITFSDVPAPGIYPQSINIPDAGIITLPYNVQVQAAGKTTTELERDVRNAYVPKLFVNLTATVRTEKRAFYVDGEVKTPSRLEYIGEMTVLRAISTAGGFTDFANRKKIRLTRAGKTTIHNWYKILEKPALDPLIIPGDRIDVKRKYLW